MLRVKNVLGQPDFEDWKAPHIEHGLPEGVPVLTVDADAIETKTVDYNRSESVDPRVLGFSDEQLIKMNLGAYDPKGGVASMIGASGFTVAGAAGQSCMEIPGVPSLVMADGPAGLRLSRQYAVDRQGKIHPLESSIPASLTDFMPKPLLWALKLMSYRPKKTDRLGEQYASTIPIGTAVAQSFDPELAESFGKIVGEEMERFGVHLWLAPALNIHRSIRCGRNFEYYSEDPLISGKMAAAVTRAVQARRGCGVTIKHFCCNNQETNRYQSDSIVSHRALREIYLRGFEICIRESHPVAVMTSYNLLNGVHTSERRDLIEDILRAEFGFGGFVMSDWLIFGMNDKRAAHPFASAEKIPAAGNDVLMPGGKRDCKRIRNALKNGTLDREQAQKNVTRLLRVARYLFEPEVIFGGDAPTR